MAMVSKAFVCVLAVFFALPRTSSANAFIKTNQKLRGQNKVLSEASIEQRFLEEVRGLTGKGPADLQLPAIQSALTPMWNSLPKNQYGGLDNAQVKYALHRLFVQRHGWHIDGLGDISNKSSSPVGIFKEKVPTFLMELFSEAFGETGLKLSELSVFAATLERLIHDENIDRLEKIYKALDSATETDVAMDTGDRMMQAFVASLVLGQDFEGVAGVSKGIRTLEKTYPAWEATRVWLKGIREVEAPAGSDAFSFGVMQNATEQVSMQLGGFLGKECQKMKDALLEAEEKNTGRVLLSNFYKKGMEKGIHFVEKPEYLRELGALDESQPGEPRVIVANFIISPNNCLFDTGFYSVCCQNECESVMGNLENAIGASEASPEAILAATQKISTRTGGGDLPKAVAVRLELLAERHGGKVPMYGRLFAQWLHSAFPHDCPFPHTTGSINPLTPDDYKAATSLKSSFGASEMHKYIGNVAEQQVVQEEDSLEMGFQWSEEEEMLFLPAEAAPRTITGMLVRGGLSLAVLTGVGVAAMNAVTRFGGKEVLLPNSQKSHYC